VLPVGSGFEFLTVGCSLFLLPLGLVMAYPPTAAAGVAFSLVFLNFVAPANPMVFDLAGSINAGLALIMGVLFGTLAYVLIFPPDPQAARRYVTYRIRRGLELISLQQPVPATSAHWESRMYDRVIRLNDPQNPSGTPTDEWLDAGLGALNLGNEILRLRRWLEHGEMSPTVRAAVTKVVEGFSRFLVEPQRATILLNEQLRYLSARDPGRGHPDRLMWARAVGSLGEMDIYLDHHPRLTKMDEALK
jgi:uncharacterized membrane protein YccC